MRELLVDIDQGVGAGWVIYSKWVVRRLEC